ncbi:DUF5336 domain-containing protein [Gordonia shandongensis]|uniref:DUF5336 domain-containing protein n=1 Tax=Gordonia shandongensis TaxID=376351 RepID=UPI00040F61B9|nr:DUF5336 domain-containing protein [Gordonia shandongensis]
MTYPQSGSGYGQQYGQQAGYQPPSAYGQQAQYGQQGQYDQQAQYGQQAQAQYGQQAQDPYGQQYAAQAQYGYQQPKAPSQGLPANISTILAGVVGGLGVLMLFLGFLAGYKMSFRGSSDSVKLFETAYSAPYIVFAAAGFVALTSLLLGSAKWVASIVFSLTAVATFVTIFQFATLDGMDNGVGAILLLVFTILALIAAIVWLLVEGGQLTVAPPAAGTPAAAAAAPSTDAAAYGYGSYGQQDQAQSGAGTYQPGTYQAGTYQAGSYQATQYGQQQTPAPSYGQTEIVSTDSTADAAEGATTAFPKPESGNADQQ